MAIVYDESEEAQYERDRLEADVRNLVRARGPNCERCTWRTIRCQVHHRTAAWRLLDAKAPATVIAGECRYLCDPCHLWVSGKYAKLERVYRETGDPLSWPVTEEEMTFCDWCHGHPDPGRYCEWCGRNAADEAA